MVLDNGAFHKAKTLKIPDNIGLIFLPPYSPELNPAENIWAMLKRKFTNKFFKPLEEVSEFMYPLYQPHVSLQKIVQHLCWYGRYKYSRDNAISF